jgi:hypothetical protein
MHKYLFLVFLIHSHIGFSQKEILVPFRVGDSFGLSNINGKLKLKPQFDYIQPIGNGYFKYSNYQKVPDTTNYYNGRVEIKEKTITTTGVLWGTKVIIKNSDHRHFSYSPEGIIVGSQESYVSKNSNFYTLKGEKLLSENVKKFRLMGRENRQDEPSKYISIFAEHFDNSVSIYQFDKEKQKLVEPLLDHVKNFELDRNSSSDDYFVCTYTDNEDTYQQMMIFYDDELKRFSKEAFPKNTRTNNQERIIEDLYDSGSDRYIVAEPDFKDEARVPRPEASSAPIPREKPKPIVYFQKLENGFAKFGNDTLALNPGESISFADVYSKTQKQPLIVEKDGKLGLIYSDSSRSELTYDSLRYIKNQFGFFTHNSTFIFLVGKKNQNTSQWSFGMLDEFGKEIIPMMYESLQPNLPEIFIDNDDEPGQGNFDFRQPYTYSKDNKKPLTLQRQGILTAQLNGKHGLIDLKNTLVMPFEYDFIWENGLDFLNTMRIEDEFNVYEKDNHYGVFKLNSKLEKSEDTGAIFPNIPVFKYPNYGEVIGFDLYNVAIPSNLYYYLVGSNGKVYRK